MTVNPSEIRKKYVMFRLRSVPERIPKTERLQSTAVAVTVQTRERSAETHDKMPAAAENKSGHQKRRKTVTASIMTKPHFTSEHEEAMTEMRKKLTVQMMKSIHRGRVYPGNTNSFLTKLIESASSHVTTAQKIKSDAVNIKRSLFSRRSRTSLFSLTNIKTPPDNIYAGGDILFMPCVGAGAFECAEYSSVYASVPCVLGVQKLFHVFTFRHAVCRAGARDDGKIIRLCK